MVWPLGSKDLFYRNGDKRMAVEITTGPTLTVGTPRVLFEGDFVHSPGSRAYWDATRDGQRFLMLKKVEQPARAGVRFENNSNQPLLGFELAGVGVGSS